MGVKVSKGLGFGRGYRGNIGAIRGSYSFSGFTVFQELFIFVGVWGV